MLVRIFTLVVLVMIAGCVDNDKYKSIEDRLQKIESAQSDFILWHLSFKVGPKAFFPEVAFATRKDCFDGIDAALLNNFFLSRLGKEKDSTPEHPPTHSEFEYSVFDGLILGKHERHIYLCLPKGVSPNV